MYLKKTYRFSSSNEYEFTYKGRYGAAGEKRSPKRKATPEQVKKQNQYYRERKLRRKIKANFGIRDYWTTLKFPKGTRLSMEEVKKAFRRFRNKMRAAYKKNKTDFKYIYRIEIGRNGGIHIHILLNRIRGMPDMDLLIRKCWQEAGDTGGINYQLLYEAGGYVALAEYIVKQPDEELDRQLSFFSEEDRRELVTYGCSRNLKVPEPEKKEYRRWTMRKIIEKGPVPTKGYYIDKNSVRTGINPYTGMSYLYYTENKLDNHPSGEGG